LAWEVFNCGLFACTEHSGRATIHFAANLLALVVLLDLWRRDLASKKLQNNSPSAH
jgi:hypothetical protein